MAIGFKLIENYRPRGEHMGILGRINSAIKSNINSVIDKMSDPAKEIDLLVTDMEDNVNKAKQEVITITAAAKRAGMRCDDLERQVESWQKRAEQAVRMDDDDLAREALQERNRLTKEFESARTAHQEQVAYAEKLKDSLKALEARLKQVKLKKESIKERAQAAKSGSLQGGKAFKDFNRLEDRIQALESEVELGSSLDARAAELEAKFASMEPEKDPKVEDALADLKRKLDQE
jgi:phage shock protein A